MAAVRGLWWVDMTVDMTAVLKVGRKAAALVGLMADARGD